MLTVKLVFFFSWFTIEPIFSLNLKDWKKNNKEMFLIPIEVKEYKTQIMGIVLLYVKGINSFDRVPLGTLQKHDKCTLKY